MEATGLNGLKFCLDRHAVLQSNLDYITLTQAPHHLHFCKKEIENFLSIFLHHGTFSR